MFKEARREEICSVTDRLSDSAPRGSAKWIMYYQAAVREVKSSLDEGDMEEYAKKAQERNLKGVSPAEQDAYVF